MNENIKRTFNQKGIQTKLQKCRKVATKFNFKNDKLIERMTNIIIPKVGFTKM